MYMWVGLAGWVSERHVVGYSQSPGKWKVAAAEAAEVEGLGVQRNRRLAVAPDSRKYIHPWESMT